MQEVYISVRVIIEDGADIDEVLSEMGDDFDHDQITGYEIINWVKVGN